MANYQVIATLVRDLLTVHIVREGLITGADEDAVRAAARAYIEDKIPGSGPFIETIDVHEIEGG